MATGVQRTPALHRPRSARDGGVIPGQQGAPEEERNARGLQETEPVLPLGKGPFHMDHDATFGEG